VLIIDELDAPPPDLPPATIPYPNGRGRRAPTRLRGYDPSDPILPMLDQGRHIGGIDINRIAAANLADPDLWRTRKDLKDTRFKRLCVRKRKYGPRSSGGDVPPEHTTFVQWLRGDFMAVELHVLQWLAMIAQVRTNEVGLWKGSGWVQPFTRQEMAERLDFHHRYDEKDILRAPQLDRVLSVLKYAGLIEREGCSRFDSKTQTYRAQASTFRVTDAFWELAGVARLRAEYLSPKGSTTPSPSKSRNKAERIAAWREQKLKDFAAELLDGGHVLDYGPQAPRAPDRHHRTKLPP
jgi:hypothetical protein